MRDTRLSTLVVNAQAEALAKLADGGYVDIYDGERPKSADDPVTTQTLGVSLQLGVPAFLPAEGGTLTANPLGSNVAVGRIKATWARVTAADHKTALKDLSVGTRDANIILPTTNIEPGVTVSASSFVHSVAKSTPGS